MERQTDWNEQDLLAPTGLCPARQSPGPASLQAHLLLADASHGRGVGEALGGHGGLPLETGLTEPGISAWFSCQSHKEKKVSGAKVHPQKHGKKTQHMLSPAFISLI